MPLENSDTKDAVKPSSSPERNSFQRDNYINRCKDDGKEPSPAYLKMFDDIKADEEAWANSIDHSNDLEWDLRTNQWILDKVRSSDSYAQNLYAAMCNMRFVRKELFPYLRQDPDKDLWSCSWRSSGGIIADMLGKGDYIDWYCSGMGGLNQEYDSKETNEQWQKRTGYVPEGLVTEEIEADLLRLGWIPVPWPNDK